MTEFEEIQQEITKLLIEEKLTRLKLKNIERMKSDLLLLLCGYDELISNEGKEILKEINKNDRN